MTVFRTYLKIIQKNKWLLLMYIGICVGVSMIMANANQWTEGGGTFEQAEGKVAIVNNDDGLLTDGFIEFVEASATVVDISDQASSPKENETALQYGTPLTEKEKQDAIFERKVDAIFIIPQGFSEDIMSGDAPKIELRIVPDSTYGRFIEMQFNRWINIAKLYAGKGMSEEDIIDSMDQVLQSQTEVTLAHKESDVILGLAAYYNFANYGIMAILIFAVGICMQTFNRKEIKNRTLTSGLRANTLMTKLFGANLMLGLITALVFFAFSYVLCGKEAVSEKGLLMAANCLVLSMSAVGLAFLIGSLVKKKEAVNAMMNVFSLGSSFLCGAFVPQEYLGAPVLAMGRVFPSYWYITNNNTLRDAIHVADVFPGYWINLAIMVGYTVVFILLALALSKKRT